MSSLCYPFFFAPEKELVLSPGSLIFAAATQGSPLGCLAVVASGTYMIECPIGW